MDNNIPDCVEILRGETAVTHSVIWMHGLGADANDFTPILPYFRFPNHITIRFVFPNAAVRRITINNGMAMRAWYDIKEFSPTAQEDATGIMESVQVINNLIYREIERGVNAKHIFLVGFSQGAAMALISGLLFPKQLAGIIALSGYLPLTTTADKQRHLANHDTPILMVHGEYDPVIDISRAQASQDILQTWGYKVQWQNYPMQHEVCAPEVAAINQFVIDNV